MMMRRRFGSAFQGWGVFGDPLAEAIIGDGERGAGAAVGQEPLALASVAAKARLKTVANQTVYSATKCPPAPSR